MITYSERFNKITLEFAMFAGFAALEERFRALNNNASPDDNVNDVTQGFATAGVAVCGLRLLYQLGGLSYAAYMDCKNYILGAQNAIQPDPFDQLEANVQEVRSVHQLKIDRVKELEKELEAGKEALEDQEDRLTKRIVGLEKDITELKVKLNSQNNLSINSLKQ